MPEFVALPETPLPSSFRAVSLAALLKPLWRQRQVQGAVGPIGILTALFVTWAGGTVIVLLVLNYLTTISNAIAPPSATTCRNRERKNVAGGIGAAASSSRSFERKKAGDRKSVV